MVTQSQGPPGTSRRGCTGCRCCLVSLILIVGGLVAAWFLVPAILRATGRMPPPAEELYSGAPDPAASEVVEAVMTDAGIEGARVVVLPIKDSDRQLAVITIDASVVIGGDDKESVEEAFLKVIRGLAQANAAGLGLERTVVDIRDDNGEPFIAVTTDQASIDAFAEGRIDRRAFLRTVDADLSNLLDLIDLQALLRGE